MGGRTGALAGWSDPSEPGWQERAIARVRARERKSSVVRQARRRGVLQLFFDTEFVALLDAAAFKRGMSLGAYGRRALAKQIAKDLEIDWRIPLSYCARVSPYGSRPSGRTPKGEKTMDDGEGYGDWSN